MIFEYSVQKTFNESIDVVDIGNTALTFIYKNSKKLVVFWKTGV